MFFCFGHLEKLNAQEYNTVENVTVDTKLQNHNITCIVQDNNGFMWIGTNFGLYRYDGYHFIAYKVNINPFLLDNNIRSLLIDGENLWIGTKGGINVLNVNSNQIASFKNNLNDENSIPSNYVTKIFKDQNSNIWIGYNTNKVSKYIGNEKFKNFTLENLSANCVVYDIKEIKANKLAIQVLDKKPSINSIVIATLKQNQLVQNKIHNSTYNSQVLFKSNNQIYLSQEKDIFLYNDDIEEFNFFKRAFNNKYLIHGLSFTDDFGKVYVGTNKSVFYVLNSSENFSISETHIGENDILINSFFVDNTGLVWICTTNGLFKFKQQKMLFKRYLFSENGSNPNKMRSIIQDKNGAIFAVNQNGIYEYDFKKNDFINKNWINQVNSIPFAVLEYTNNDFLIGTQGEGLALYNKTTNVYKPYYKINTSFTSNIHVLKLLKHNQYIWVGTSNGLYFFSKNEEILRKVDALNFKVPYLKNDLIFEMIPHSKNELWIGSSTGLYLLKMDESSKPMSIKVSKITNVPYEIRSVLKSKQHLWLATQANGLVKYNIKNQKAEIIDESFGLSNNTVYSIAPGVKNELWIGTLSGLSRFDTINKQFINFHQYDGLAGNEFNSSSQLNAKNGELFLGGQNGISSFNPSKIEVKETNLKLNITSINWYNSKKDSTYQITINSNNKQSIVLPFSNAFVNFEFSLSDYYKPENNTFKYRFLGLHSDWRVLNKTNILSFTNLPPGEYKLEVMAATNYGMWNKQSISMPIIVSQIFYKRWWFLTILGLIMLVFIYSMRKYELYHIQKMEKLRMRISRDLHDDLGSSLTGIAIRTELLNEKIKNKETGAFLNEIAMQSRNAVDTLSDIVWAIDSRNNSVENLSDRMHNVLFLLLTPSNIEFSFETISDQKPIYLDQNHRQHVFLIFKEAITNIIKHSNATKVSVSLTKDKYHLKLIIKDNGTINNKTEISLNGNGIKNMKLRADKINGKLSIYNQNGYTIELIFDYKY
jgi:ligand-binding sensor domain-containing protein/two-component sensor histidine kinase